MPGFGASIDTMDKEYKQEKTKKNRLDSFDFCVRKSIAVHVFGNNTGESLAEFAKAVDTMQPTLSKWISRETSDGKILSTMESRHAPTMAQIFQASAYLSISIAEMIDIAIDGEEKSPLIPLRMLEKMKKLSNEFHEKGIVVSPKNDNRTTDYLKKINRVSNAQYYGFFLQDSELGHLIIDTYEPYKSGSVPMTARIIGKAGNPYRGNVVSPPGNDHLYFYIRQEDGKNDRGLMVFYIDDDMQDAYKCGSGILVSTDRKTGKVRLQWVAIIRTGESEKPSSKDTMQILHDIQEHETEINQKDHILEASLREIDKVIRPILEEDLPVIQNHHIQFDDLSDRQEKLYDMYKCLYENNIESAERRVRIIKSQYEKAVTELERLKCSQHKVD